MKKMQEIRCFFDGAVKPHNPGGHGGYGMLVTRDDVRTYSEANYIGCWPDLSNNVAEYAGAIAALRYLLNEGITEALIQGDSMLVINQLNGKWKAKNGVYFPYYREAYALRVRLPKVMFEWIPREMNSAADDLSKIAVSKRTVGFQLDPQVEPVAPPQIKKRRRTRDMYNDLNELWLRKIAE